MQEIVLLYHIDEHTRYAMNTIFHQLGVKVIEIKDDEIIILVLNIGHRKNIY